MAVVYCWDRGRWRKEAYADSSNRPGDLAALDETYLLGGSTNGSRLMSVRKEIGAYGAGTYRDPSRDAGVAETFKAITKEWWPAGPIGKATLRSIYIRYHQWNAGTSEKVTVTPYVDGVDSGQGKTFGGKASVGTYVERLDFNALETTLRSGRNFYLDFSSSPTDSEAQTYSIEEVWVQVIADKERR